MPRVFCPNASFRALEQPCPSDADCHIPQQDTAPCCDTSGELGTWRNSSDHPVADHDRSIEFAVVGVGIGILL
jgi:hypothetical protein